MSGSEIKDLEKGSATDEIELLRDVVRPLGSLRYGSVNLTVDDGRLVEIQKVEQIRMNSMKAKK